MSTWLSIVGIGEDGLEPLSTAAKKAIAEARLLIGGERHLAMLPDDGRERKSWPSPLMVLVEEVLSRRGEKICILATGDPMQYGIGVTFAKRLKAEEMAIFPSLSAFSLAAARLGWDLNRTDCLTLHGRPLDLLNAHLRDGARLLALSDSGRTPADVAALLTRMGYGESRLTILEHMGGIEEKIFGATAADLGGKAFRDFNTLAIECKAGPNVMRLTRTPGLPDTAFAHDGQLTKQEVRSVTLSALAPNPGELLWDIGAGCGSIAIEWMRMHPLNCAVVIETRQDRLALIEENRRTLGVPQLKIVEGVAPAALKGLEAPDAVFIGGGVTHPGVFETTFDALKPGGRLVANAVTMEGEARLFDLYGAKGGSLIRLNFARAGEIGGFTGWKPFRQVTQLRMVKE